MRKKLDARFKRENGRYNALVGFADLYEIAEMAEIDMEDVINTVVDYYADIDWYTDAHLVASIMAEVLYRVLLKLDLEDEEIDRVMENVHTDGHEVNYMNLKVMNGNNGYKETFLQDVEKEIKKFYL